MPGKKNAQELNGTEYESRGSIVVSYNQCSGTYGVSDLVCDQHGSSAERYDAVYRVRAISHS